jgi:DNA-binding transcriptional regulator GbsR (MarR family)
MARKSERTDPATGPTAEADDPALIVARAQDRVADAMGDIAEFWGFTRTMGRIFGLVYMSPEPVDQSTVRTRLDISAGSASTTMTALLEWGVLHRDGRLYVAETNFFKLITAVLRQREAARVEQGIEAARSVVAELRNADRDDPRVAFALQRAEHLLGFFEMGRSFLEAFVERSPIRAILNGLARTASRLRTGPSAGPLVGPLAAPVSAGHGPGRDDDFATDETEVDRDQENYERIDA